MHLSYNTVMVTQSGLSSFTKNILGKRKFIVALNSEPYVHNRTLKGISINRGSGGAQNLLDGILRQTGGSMVAIASGSADHEVVDKKDKVLVPPGEQSYTLKRLFLTKQELEYYYNGFSNQTLWPLCHMSFTKPIFEHKWWEAYEKVNQKFADAILEECGSKDAFVWINDYQLCLLPKLLKEKKPSIKIGMFWHIPWPIKEIFGICPWSRELLEGLISSDFIGFHREGYYRNFKDCTAKVLGISVFPSDRSIFHNSHITTLGALPAGVDYQEIEEVIDQVNPNEDEIKNDFGIDYEHLIIGADRVDHTKGLIERLFILDMFFERYPEFQGKVVHLMIGAPSRTYIPSYHKLTSEVSDFAERINWKYSHGGWQPIKFVNEAISREKLFAYYRCADVCMVTSLEDGMNLVSKEYAICVEPEQGILMLSKFAGATRELSDALLFNPYDTEASVKLLYKALTMSPAEKKELNTKMKNVLKKNTIYKWGKEFIRATMTSGEDV